MFGNLTLSALPHEPIVVGAAFFMGVVALSVIGALFYFKKWKWLWTEWLTSVDHKKIGVMYIILAFVMLLIVGLINLAVPLQIGARDVAYPFLNSLSLWLTVAGAMLVNLSLVVGEFAATGWLAYPPLSGVLYSPGVGVDS